MNIMKIYENSLSSTIVAPKKTDNNKELKKACADFEAMLINSLLKSMRKTMSGETIFGKSAQKDIFESMYDQQIATDIARGSKNIGIKDMLYKTLERKNNSNYHIKP